MLKIPGKVQFPTLNVPHVSTFCGARSQIWAANLHTSKRYLWHRDTSIDHCYSLLRVSEESSIDEVRESYIQLAKQYHPDSSSKSADTNKFMQVKQAYKTVLQHRQRIVEHEKIREEIEKAYEEMDIEHTAPQHRQYLEHEGIGFGTPSTRQRQYQQHKVNKAVENVYEYKVEKMSAKYEKSLMEPGKKMPKKKVVIRSNMERLVEDLIAESIAKGEFDDLPGKGKPLKYDTTHNPMLDTTTSNLNRILVENGYVPDWIQLSKEIRDDMSKARHKLLQDYIKHGQSLVLSGGKAVWKQQVLQFKDTVQEVNKKVDNYNLMVPYIWKQMVHYDHRRELQKVLGNYEEQMENEEVLMEQSIIHENKGNNTGKVQFRDIVRYIKELFSLS